MNFKQYFIYQTDYQHWANDVLFNALDRIGEEARASEQKLFFGSIHRTVDHLRFFYGKWFARLRGESETVEYSATVHTDWRELKNAMRQEVRTMQHWMERQQDGFFDSQIRYRRTLNREEKGTWVRDAFTHIYTYAALERGYLSAAGSALGAPCPDMSYFTYRMEMGEHLEHLRKTEPTESKES